MPIFKAVASPSVAARTMSFFPANFSIMSALRPMTPRAWRNTPRRLFDVRTSLSCFTSALSTSFPYPAMAALAWFAPETRLEVSAMNSVTTGSVSGILLARGLDGFLHDGVDLGDGVEHQGILLFEFRGPTPQELAKVVDEDVRVIDGLSSCILARPQDEVFFMSGGRAASMASLTLLSTSSATSGGRSSSTYLCLSAPFSMS